MQQRNKSYNQHLHSTRLLQKAVIKINPLPFSPSSIGELHEGRNISAADCAPMIEISLSLPELALILISTDDCDCVIRAVEQAIFNPRRACAARVIVVVLCACVNVCVCVFVCVRACVCVSTILALQATRRFLSDTNSISATAARTQCGDFAKTTAFKIEKSGRSREMFLDPAHQLVVSMPIMRQSTDACGGVNGRVRNPPACGGLSTVLDPPREAGFRD